MGKNVLVVSAHPDDETLGAGGTLLRHIEQGDEVTWVIITNIFQNQGFRKEKVEKRQTEIKGVAESYGFRETVKLDYPTMTLNSGSLEKLIGELSNVIQDFRPEVLYVMNRSDAHSDHRISFDAVMACTKSFRSPFIREIFMYECLSETEFAPPLPEKAFQPNCFVDITSTMDKKIDIMNLYESEGGEHPFPRSEKNIRALATFRGATAGMDYAEAFQILKFYRFKNV